jgi:glutathione S-transferase
MSGQGRFPVDTLQLSLDDAHAYTGALLRGGRGVFALSEPDQRPESAVELYDFEACPYCRKVREILTELDLDYICRPCGKGSNNREYVENLGGKEQFPFLVDPNTGQTMYESEDIIDYLCDHYGDGRWPLARTISPVNTITAVLPTLTRPTRGNRVRDECQDRDQPDKLPELYNFEGSPFCRKVREVLCELNLDFYVHNVGKRSPKRGALKNRGGRIQVPFFVDPNKTTQLYESDDIITYLEQQYAR